MSSEPNLLQSDQLQPRGCDAAADDCAAGCCESAVQPSTSGGCSSKPKAPGADTCCSSKPKASGADSCCSSKPKASGADSCCSSKPKASGADSCCSSKPKASGADSCCSSNARSSCGDEAKPTPAEASAGCQQSCCDPSTAAGRANRARGCDKECCGASPPDAAPARSCADACEDACCDDAGATGVKSGCAGSRAAAASGRGGAKFGKLDEETKADAPLAVGVPLKAALFSIQGMTCAGCSSRVESHLSKMAHVVSVNVSLLTCKARVQFVAGSGFSTEEARSTIEQLGFEAQIDTDASECSLELAFHSGFASDPKSRAGLYARMDAVQHAAGAIAGVSLASLLPQQQGKGAQLPVLRVIYNPSIVGARSVLQHAQAAAGEMELRVHEPVEAKASASIDAEFYKTLWYVVVCVVLCLPIIAMTAIVPLFPSAHDAVEEYIVGMLGWKELVLGVLASPIQLWVGWPIYKMAWGSLYHNHRANMDVLIMLSTTTAYLYSVVSAFRLAFTDPATLAPGEEDQFHTFFETSAYLLTLILIGRLMNEYAKGRTSKALSALMQMQVCCGCVCVPECASRRSPVACLRDPHSPGRPP